jgi:AraC-like DNA-binding protein
MARERLVRIIDHVGRARGSPGGPAEAAAAGGVLELFAWLAERPTAGAAGNRGERAVAQVAAELRLWPERSWRVADLARRAGVSPAYLARRFRLRFGHTLARYQMIHRIGAAQALLACTTDPVGAVGARVGLPDPHHFNKLFRRVSGVPPSVFRSTHRAGDDPISR